MREKKEERRLHARMIVHEGERDEESQRDVLSRIPNDKGSGCCVKLVASCILPRKSKSKPIMNK